MSSHVLEIRKRTAEERLRGDHIDMMYQLQDAQDEIDNLHKEVKRLENLLEGKPPGGVTDTPSQDCGHESTILALQEELLALQSELKTIKTASMINEKSRKSMAQIQTELSHDEKAKYDRMIACHEMASEDIHGMAMRALDIVRAEKAAKEDEPPRTCLSCSELKAANGTLTNNATKSNAALENLRKQLKVQDKSHQKEVDSLGAEIERYVSEVHLHKDELHRANTEIDALQEEKSAIKEQNDILQKELRLLKSRKFTAISTQTDEAPPVTVPLPVIPAPPLKSMDGPCFIIDDDPYSTTFLTPSVEDDVDARHHDPGGEDEGGDENRTKISSFPQYVAMKRENPSLSPRDRGRAIGAANGNSNKKTSVITKRSSSGGNILNQSTKTKGANRGQQR